MKAENNCWIKLELCIVELKVNTHYTELKMKTAGMGRVALTRRLGLLDKEKDLVSRINEIKPSKTRVSVFLVDMDTLL